MKSMHQRAEVESAAAHHHRPIAPPPDFRANRARPARVGGGVAGFRGIENPVQMMWSHAEKRFSGLGGENREPAVELECVAANDFAAHPACE